MNELLYKNFEKAKQEGRLCRRCGWMITKINWKKGFLLCGGCWDALKGVDVKGGWKKPLEEFEDITGEAL